MFFVFFQAKVLIKEQLPKYFGSQTKLVTTQCVILETEKLSKISKYIAHIECSIIIRTIFMSV